MELSYKGKMGGYHRKPDTGQDEGGWSRAAEEIITEQYSKSMEVLQGKRGILEKAARLLLEKEKVEGDELKALMDES